MLPNSMDYITNQAATITTQLQCVAEQFQQSFAEFDIQQNKLDILVLIETMHALDDMLHEPSYQLDCFVNYWTLQSFQDCVDQLKSVLDDLEANRFDQELFANLQTRIHEALYLWEDNYLEDFSHWSKKVSALCQQPVIEHSYDALFAKPMSSRTPYLVEKLVEPSETSVSLEALELETGLSFRP